jgi:3-oxoadipate enol-lactonase
MPFATLNGVTLHYRYRPGAGVPVVFLNSLGTDFRIWDGVIAGLGADVPVLCLDKRGHGLSDEGEITMALLAGDVAALMDHLRLGHAVICGVSVGGMIAQALAAARPDLAAGLVLCCTGARIGDATGWNARIDTVRRDGIAAMSETILERWFSTRFRSAETAALAGYRNMLTRTPVAGYAGVCAAIRDTDFTEESARLALPTRCLAGAEDLATPPDLVAALAALIPGATVEVLAGCGHLPCIEAPGAVAGAVSALRRRLS